MQELCVLSVPECSSFHDGQISSVLALTHMGLTWGSPVQGHWMLAEKLFQQLEAEAHASARSEAPQASPQTPSPSSLNAYAVDWASPQRRQSPDASGWEHQQTASMTAMAATPAMSINTAAQVAEVDDRRLSSGSFGDMPTHLAEQVCVLSLIQSCCCVLSGCLTYLQCVLVTCQAVECALV